ncbi:hypothetical protein PRIPAC_96439, partial [Pristionchus pacificus]|uniref:Uncharacterized protein n=1 Tax=Pristionchus pacificus TaxID=54126 RepID=A0A2A6BJJ7_PRIPA
AKSVVITGLECRDFYFTWKSEVFTCDSSCSVYFQAGMSPLRIFDIFQTYFISILLLITIFFACLVYTKLLFYLPHSRNYTFKLIVFNGIVNLLSCSMYLLVYQLTSYNFMYRFYLYLKDRGFYIIAAVICALFDGMALNSALCIALNRLIAIRATTTEKNFKLFFYVSLLFSTLLPVTKIVDLFTFGPLVLEEYYFDYGQVLLPITIFSNNILSIIGNVQAAMVCCATLLLNSRIVIHRNKAEKGLMITSIVSYLFYTLYLINTLLADYFSFGVCAYTRYFYLGIASITPFWCLILFTKTVRQSAFKRTKEISFATVHS